MIEHKNKEREFIRLYSLLAHLEKNEKYFNKAKELSNALNGAADTEDDQQIRTRLQAYAYYYDLCFYRLTDQDKKEIQAQIIRHIDWLAEHNYLKTDNFGGGHQHYANISAIIAGLAIYHEEPSVQETVRLLVNNVKHGFQPFYQYLAEEDGGFHMWWEYSRYYIFNELEFCSIWKNATGEDLFEKNKWLEQTVYFLAYGLRGDFSFWGTGDNHSRHPYWRENVLLKEIASEYQNGYAQNLADKIEQQNRSWPSIDELFFKLIWEKDIESKPIESLPLVKEFKRAGVYVFKEGWGDAGVNALFKNTPIYFFNHSHRDANSFAIWYKGDLAIDSGYYDAYGSDHWRNYYIRSIAHNTILIYDPDEKFELWGKQWANDGGQRFITKPHAQPYNVEDLKSPAFQVGKNQLLADNENYTLVVGDATKAYDSKKCELFKRYFLFLKKVENWDHPVIVVFDKVVSTKPEFKKSWLLHSNNKPKVKNNLVTIQNNGGKLWNYVIQPEDFNIEVIGGEGKEFEVNGVNYPPKTQKQKDIAQWAGAWRVELSEKIPQKETYFLNVLVPTEKYKIRQPAVERIDNGVRVENWKIVFENDDLKISGD